MTISPEAKEAATRIVALINEDDDVVADFWHKEIQLAINSATKSAIQSAKDSAANFRKSEVKRIEAERECDRLRGEVEKAYKEGWMLPDFADPEDGWNRSRAKRVVEGKE